MPRSQSASQCAGTPRSRKPGGSLGIDTQDLLVNGSPADVAQDVRRVKDLLGPRLVVSPSHEAVLPNVPPENLVAMAQATVNR